MPTQIEALSGGERETLIRPILNELAAHPLDGRAYWNGWRLAQITGGANNLLYRAATERADLAIKFTIRDARDRAGREYNTLQALSRAGVNLGPRAILLDRQRYTYPVVVQTWVDGTVVDAPPVDDAEWHALLAHFAAIHQRTPKHVAEALPDAVLSIRSPAAARDHIQQQVARLPRSAQPPELQGMLTMIEDMCLPSWPPPRPTLCRCDPNIRNLIRRPDRWLSADWENSGWGDPAFEIADLIAHPSYIDVPEEQWENVITMYCSLSDDPTAIERIPIYHAMMLLWCAARFAFSHYHVIHHQLTDDHRLVPRNASWDAMAEDRLAHYLEGLLTRLLTCESTPARYYRMSVKTTAATAAPSAYPAITCAIE